MPSFRMPSPVLDQRELRAVPLLTRDYRRHVAPGPLAGGMRLVEDCLARVAPEGLRRKAFQTIEAACGSENLRAAFALTSRILEGFSKHASALTLTPGGATSALREAGLELDRFEQICALRSYHIEAVLSQRNYRNLVTALGQGTLTGLPGLVGVPLGIAAGLILHFRCVQSTALLFGYDVALDVAEMEFAAAATALSLDPDEAGSSDAMAASIQSLMRAVKPHDLKPLLDKHTLAAADRWGELPVSELVRSLTEYEAEAELHRERLEARLLRDVLSQVGGRLAHVVSRRAVPFVGAVLGGVADTWTMSRVARAAGLVYHKRFLAEKERRVARLYGRGPPPPHARRAGSTPAR